MAFDKDQQQSISFDIAPFAYVDGALECGSSGASTTTTAAEINLECKLLEKHSEIESERVKVCVSIHHKVPFDASKLRIVVAQIKSNTGLTICISKKKNSKKEPFTFSSVCK